jgi:triosephosphate isomerase
MKIFSIIILLVIFVAIRAFIRTEAPARLSTSLSARKPIIAGNWKCNTDLDSAVALAKDVVEMTKGVDADKTEIALVPPFIFLRDVAQVIEKSPQNIKLGAQNSYWEDKGAFTGATSAPMLKSVGTEYCLVGHSERRAIFNEDDSDINNVILRLLANDVTPILCIGESKEEYDLGLNKEVCTLQIKKDLQGLSGDQVRKIVIAYEPVWAIGTGLSATPEIAQSVHAAIRKCLADTYGSEIADEIRIQYGGSVTPETIDELMKCPDIDGALVGGASLVAEKFALIAMFN